MILPGSLSIIRAISKAERYTQAIVHSGSGSGSECPVLLCTVLEMVVMGEVSHPVHQRSYLASGVHVTDYRIQDKL
jgi:hypothetical protein